MRVCRGEDDTKRRTGTPSRMVITGSACLATVFHDIPGDHVQRHLVVFLDVRALVDGRLISFPSLLLLLD